jgi:hypothetical protein
MLQQMKMSRVNRAFAEAELTKIVDEIDRIRLKVQQIGESFE